MSVSCQKEGTRKEKAWALKIVCLKVWGFKGCYHYNAGSLSSLRGTVLWPATSSLDLGTPSCPHQYKRNLVPLLSLSDFSFKVTKALGLTMSCSLFYFQIDLAEDYRWFGMIGVDRNGMALTWGWCTGTTQRDAVGREEGGGFRMGSTCIPVMDSFWYLAKLIQLCKV